MYHYTTDGKRVEGPPDDGKSKFSSSSRFVGENEPGTLNENFEQPSSQSGESSPKAGGVSHWTIAIICAIVLAIIFLIMSIYCFYKSRSDSSYFTYAIVWLIIGILGGSAAGLFYYWANKKPENFKFGITK